MYIAIPIKLDPPFVRIAQIDTRDKSSAVSAPIHPGSRPWMDANVRVEHKGCYLSSHIARFSLFPSKSPFLSPNEQIFTLTGQVTVVGYDRVAPSNAPPPYLPRLHQHRE